MVARLPLAWCEGMHEIGQCVALQNLQRYGYGVELQILSDMKVINDNYGYIVSCVCPQYVPLIFNKMHTE